MRISVADLTGLTLELIEVGSDKDEIRFTAVGDRHFVMFHEQNCCELVTVEDVAGDLDDLIGAPLLLAEESTSDKRPGDLPAPEYEEDSETWTFYKLATIKGSVTIRWFGRSNGYYSESVTLSEIPPES